VWTDERRRPEKRVGAGQASAAEAALVRIDARAARQQARLADATFHNNLVRQFGVRKACEHRYDASRAGWDAKTIAAANAKVIADRYLGEAFAARNAGAR